jgi:NADPH-dependent ferric siderophore reductase
MTVESIADFYSGTEVGREIGRRGREQGIEQTLLALLRSRFGDQPGIPAIASRLAHLPDQATAIDAIAQAQSADDLLNGSH